MDMEIKSFVFYRNDFENLMELEEENQKEIVCGLLREIFCGVKPKLKPQNKAIYKMLIDKIMRSVKKYHNNFSPKGGN